MFNTELSSKFVILLYLLPNNVKSFNWIKNIKYIAENGASLKIVGVHPLHKTFQPSDL